MADRISKRRGSRLSRTASTESGDEPSAKPLKARKKPKERWLLTRKTWRYMADAGRRLIPEGVHNRPEDVPKIEAYFQEVCKREPGFLLWRKNSYPGALGFRSHKKRKDRRKGGSCRKASSADEIEQIRPTRPYDLAIVPTSVGRFDVQKMKYDFLNQPYSAGTTPESPHALGPSFAQRNEEEAQEIQLLNMLEQCLSLSTADTAGVRPTSTSKSNLNFNYEELFNKLQEHLRTVTKNIPHHYVPPKREGVHFEGDHVQKSLAETLSRYFGQYTNRDKVISDLLTDRKALEKLYFELRRAKGFRSNRTGDYSQQKLPWAASPYSTRSKAYENIERRRRTGKDSFVTPPPLIEIQGESAEPTYENWGMQTDPIPEEQLVQLEEEYKKSVAAHEEEIKDLKPPPRRRSSVDNDDVSQSVSDTIKRYLRMARKKSVDSDKSDRFKRVNYDRNLRNIKAKGEITKPGDDDGLHKGCQTNENWIVTFRQYRFGDPNTLSDPESHNISSRSSIDAGIAEETEVPPNTPQGFLSSSQSFFSNLLHGKNSHEKPSSSAGTMQKSKSSSSVMHHGGRLMAKKIFRSRSKSQTRTSQTQSNWTPQGGCIWNSVNGRQVVLGDTTLLNLSEIERKVLQKVALAKLQALNLGITIKAPLESVGTVPQKPKRRPYLLKKKALTTGLFDSNRKDGDKDKETSSSGGLVFGIPLSQCVENDRISRGSSLRSQELSGNEHGLGRHGSRSSFTSLIDATRDEENGSCESLMGREKFVGNSVPGLLDKISSGSTGDITASITHEEEPAVPNILTACIRHLEKYGLQTLGIFRVSSSRKRVRQLREDFDCGKETGLNEEQCPHDVATLLKEFLRDLPDPLLCRDLYSAFVQTQKIRNRRLQFEAIEHLIQLLPSVNRDTLWTLLGFLAVVAKQSEDQMASTGLSVQGNKMDSSNLATVFAPNILHCTKPGGKEGQDRPEDRMDVISVVRTLIDYNRELFKVPAELLDEVYIHMMDSHPDALNQLLAKKSAATSGNEDSLDDLDSESTSAPLTPTALTSHMTIEHLINPEYDGCQTPPVHKKTWSREKFLHESTATADRRIRSKERDSIKEKSRKRRDDSLSRKKKDEDGLVMPSPSTKSLISILRGQRDDDLHYQKLRSSSIDSGGSVHHDGGEDRRKSTPYVLNASGVITASLKIPVQTSSQPLSLNVDHTDIPFIEDGGGFAYSAEGKTRIIGKAPELPPRRQRSISGSDSSVASVLPITGSISLGQSYDSAMGSSIAVSSPPLNTAPSSVSSSIVDAGSPPSWASTPPTSPDSLHTSVNYIPDDVQTRTSMRGQRGSLGSISPKEYSSPSQKITYPVKAESQKPTYQKDISYQRRLTTVDNLRSARDVREQRFNPSISSIGNAVLRSRTADFERIAKAESKAKSASTDKKKYTKRRYTDSRHQTRHIPDAEALETTHTSASSREHVARGGAAQTVYKRRELISSVPK